METTFTCELWPPANCEYKIDCGLAHINICSGNDLSEEIKACPYREQIFYTYEQPTKTEGEKHEKQNNNNI